MNETRTILVTVTEDDIANGNRGDCDACAVALAISREAGIPIHVDMGYSAETDTQMVSLIYPSWVEPYPGPFSANTLERCVILPDALVRWINDFDGGRPCQPITFLTAIPTEWLETGGDE